MELHEKKTTLYNEQNSEKIKTYQDQIKGIHPENLAYIDETGIDTYLVREHGYAPKGQKIYDKVSKKHKQIGIVAAKIDQNLSHPWNMTELWTAFYLNLGLKNVFYL